MRIFFLSLPYDRHLGSLKGLGFLCVGFAFFYHNSTALKEKKKKKKRFYIQESPGWKIATRQSLQSEPGEFLSPKETEAKAKIEFQRIAALGRLN